MLIEALWEDGESFPGWNFGPEVAQSWSVDSVVACRTNYGPVSAANMTTDPQWLRLVRCS